jgi:hypothetical protein
MGSRVEEGEAGGSEMWWLGRAGAWEGAPPKTAAEELGGPCTLPMEAHLSKKPGDGIQPRDRSVNHQPGRIFIRG